eukprot:222812-Prorocentrum_minimum.AAC.1
MSSGAAAVPVGAGADMLCTPPRWLVLFESSRVISNMNTASPTLLIAFAVRPGVLCVVFFSGGRECSFLGGIVS